MKKMITVLALMATLVASGQNFYSPSVSTKAYTELINGVKQSEYPGSPGSYVLNLPKPVMLFDEPTGISLTIGANGFIVTQNPTHSFALDPFVAKLEKGMANSGIYVEFDSSSVPHRLSVEWRNMIPVGHDSSEFVNFTAHMYSDQSVEFHYGPSLVTDTTAFSGRNGPDVYLILFQGNFATVLEYHKMIGSPASPTFGTAPSANTLTAVPANGTLYRYEPFNINLSEIDPATIKVYPNPVTDRLRIEGIDKGQVEAIPLNGKDTLTLQVMGEEADISHLKPGYYLLKISLKTDGEVEYLKILIK